MGPSRRGGVKKLQTGLFQSRGSVGIGRTSVSNVSILDTCTEKNERKPRKNHGRERVSRRKRTRVKKRNCKRGFDLIGSREISGTTTHGEGRSFDEASGKGVIAEVKRVASIIKEKTGLNGSRGGRQGNRLRLD